MGSSVSIDISRNSDRELKKLMKDGMNDLVRSWQKMFDSLSKRYAGKPVSKIKPALRRDWKKLGGPSSDRELTELATLISEGTDIKVIVK